MRTVWLTGDSGLLDIVVSKDRVVVTAASPFRLFGSGERYDSVLLEGGYDNAVEEKFTHQGRVSYLPVPVYLSDSFSLFLDSPIAFRTEVHEERVSFSGPFLDSDSLYVFEGPMKEALRAFMSLKGQVSTPPDWVFGQWFSANRWNCVSDVRDVLKEAGDNGFDVSVVVVEAWSDEATFYRFGEGGGWDGLGDLMKDLERSGTRLVLWQCPVFKRLDEGQHCVAHERDLDYIVSHDLEVLNSDGSPYRIPEGHWFPGSMIPDFTREETRRWWASRRRYLLDLGVSGFKTDGGEFVLSDDCVFSDGRTGRELRNIYPDLYADLYHEMGSISFSRAGYLGAWTGRLYWAGDQMSEWSELAGVLNAGLSASLSGVFFWGFDLAGFAGPMPSEELYIRSYELAAFVPIMQWHSEPVGGQFSDLMKSFDSLNDRSPWNMARLHGRNLLDICRRYSRIRTALLPYIQAEAAYSAAFMEPMMRPLFYQFPQCPECSAVLDQFLFGRSLLVAPVLHEGQRARTVVLPPGRWRDLNSRDSFTGPCSIEVSTPLSEIALFADETCQQFNLILTAFGLCP